jgi:hypothetical protein
MTRQPDEPGQHRNADGDRAAEAQAEADRELHESGGSAEPVWVVPSIVLGLVALSGSVLLFAAVVVIGATLWLLNTPPLEQGQDTFGQQWPGPSGGPGLMH